jgi:hypothetical protein
MLGDEILLGDEIRGVAIQMEMETLVARETHSEEDTLESVFGSMKEAGISDADVDRFEALLLKCNVRTLGALRLFAPQLQPLLQMMFEDNELGKLQALGFLASLQAPAPRRHPTPHPSPSFLLNASPHACTLRILPS